MFLQNMYHVYKHTRLECIKHLYHNLKNNDTSENVGIFSICNVSIRNEIHKFSRACGSFVFNLTINQDD